MEFAKEITDDRSCEDIGGVIGQGLWFMTTFLN